MATNNTAPRHKLVIRRLPPTLPEDIFWQSVSTWITDKTCLWRQFVKGKAGDGHSDSHPVHSRAYVLMADPESLVCFHRAFDGHVYRAKSGAEFQAVVEYAPFQKTTYKVRGKVDKRQGTIDEDPYYLSFLASHEGPVVKPPLQESAPVARPTTTPLLDHLRSQKNNSRSKSKMPATAESKSKAQPEIQSQPGTQPQARSKQQSKAKVSASKANTQQKGQTPLSTAAFEASRKAAALASISSAAQRRGAQAPSGPSMVAGVGREVIMSAVAPNTSDGNLQAGQASSDPVSKGKKNKDRGRKKDKGKDKDKLEGGGSLTPTGRQNRVGKPAQPPTGPWPELGGAPAPLATPVANVPGRLSRPPSRNTTPKPPPQNQPHSGGPGGPPAPAVNGAPAPSKSRRGGGGRGKGDDMPKNPLGTPQIKILPRNPNPGEGRNRGDAKAGQISDAGASAARIDI